jgi:hypothetical protein
MNQTVLIFLAIAALVILSARMYAPHYKRAEEFANVPYGRYLGANRGLGSNDCASECPTCPHGCPGGCSEQCTKEPYVPHGGRGGRGGHGFGRGGHGFGRGGGRGGHGHRWVPYVYPSDYGFTYGGGDLYYDPELMMYTSAYPFCARYGAPIDSPFTSSWCAVGRVDHAAHRFLLEARYDNGWLFRVIDPATRMTVAVPTVGSGPAGALLHGDTLQIPGRDGTWTVHLEK